MRPPPFQITRVAARARKFLAKRDRKTQAEVAAAFTFLQTISPFHHPNPNAIKRLHGRLEGLYRFRVGSLRIIYSVDEKNREIEVLTIDDRGDVYK